MKIARMDTVIANHLQNALDVFEWNKTAAAHALDLDRRTVYRMIERYKLQPGEPYVAPLLRCNDCGAVSEPGEPDPAVMHTHSCPHAGATQ